MNIHRLHLPLFVQVSANKRFYLNLNQYRNAHFQTLAKAKRVFSEEIWDQVIGLPLMTRCSLVYVLYPPTKATRDTNNVCTIVDKFFSDVLVQAGRLQDDDYTRLDHIHSCFGNVDKTNPRLDVIILDETVR